LVDEVENHSSYDEGEEKRVSSSSRVNFSKLTKKEQILRFKNMQKKIQRLQIQVRSLKIHSSQLREKLKAAAKRQSDEFEMKASGINYTPNHHLRAATNSIGNNNLYANNHNA
jgi:predicted transcriptional regulator